MTEKRKFSCQSMQRSLHGIPRACCSVLPLVAAGLIGGAHSQVQAQTVTVNGVSVNTPAPTQLPQPSANFVFHGSGNQSVSGNTMTVNQASHTLGLNWDSFNIGRDATVSFVQPDGSSRVLNRIHDLNPSVIAGHLNANGQVYMFNSNGILFQGTAQVNVGGLLASSLSLSQNQLERLLSHGLPAQKGEQLSFVWAGDDAKLLQGYGFVAVDAGARITTADGGKVVLLAPATVENRGLIEVDKTGNSGAAAEAILAAGGKVLLTAPEDPNLRGLLVETTAATVKDSLGNDQTVSTRIVNRGAAASDNAATDGRIDMGAGKVTLAALAVNQEGRVNATQAVNLNGQVMLVSGRQSTDRLTVTQTAARTEIDWQSGFGMYDEGTGKTGVKAGQTVEFIQPVGGVAYNFVHDADRTASDGSLMNVAGRSEINGTVKSSGDLFLINEKGISLGAGARLYTGNLVLSALGLNPEVQDKGLLGITDVATPSLRLFASGLNQNSDHAAARAAFAEAVVSVADGAVIRTAENGYAILAGSRIEQGGSISTPGGQTVLAAGASVYLKPPYGNALRGFTAEVDPLLYVDSGNNNVKVALRDTGLHQIINNGSISAALGNITLVAHDIVQNGTLVTTTSATRNGSINLLARDLVLSSTTRRAAKATGELLSNQDTQTEGSDVTLLYGSEAGTLRFGSASRTELGIDTSSRETIGGTQSFVSSKLDAMAAHIEVAGADAQGSGARIVAPGGRVNLVSRAQFGADTAFSADGFVPPVAAEDASVFIGEGARIDVSGLKLQRSVADLFIETEIRGDNLAGNPVQRGGALAGQKATVDMRDAVEIADLESYFSAVGRDAAELSTQGGSIVVRSSGSVIAKQGAVLDVSGGSIDYVGGSVRETRVYGPGGGLIRLNDAAPDMLVAGLETMTRQEQGYLEGKSAGSVEMSGNRIALDSTLQASTVRGERQRTVGGNPATDRTAVPLGGKLIVRDGGEHFSDFSEAQIAFVKGQSSQAAGLAFGDQAGPRLELSESLAANGFSRFDLRSDGRIEVGSGISLNLAPGGEFLASGRQVHVAGSIVAPAGKIELNTRTPAVFSGQQAENSSLLVAATAVLDTSARWVNDFLLAPSQREVLAVNGGSIKLASAHDLHVQQGAVLNVSGGAQVTSSGALKAGNAGSIDLSIRDSDAFGARTRPLMVLEGSLQGYSLGRGGTLKITAPRLDIGTAGGRVLTSADLDMDTAARAAADLNGIWIAPAFLSEGGFYNYSFSSLQGLTVGRNVTVQANPLNWSLYGSGNYRYIAGNTPIASFAQRVDLGADQRVAPTNLSFSGASVLFDEGSSIRVDAGGLVSVTANALNPDVAASQTGQITLLGSIEAPAGEIRILRETGTNELAYSEQAGSRSIYLGENSRLSVAGTRKLDAETARLLAAGLTPDLLASLNLYRGSVLGGGVVRLDAGLGHIITRSGSLIDVSGASATLAQSLDNGSVGPLQTMGSGGGLVSLTASEGMFLDGSYAARGANGAAGGSFALRFGRENAQWNQQPAPPATPRVLTLGDGTAQTWPLDAAATAEYIAGSGTSATSLAARNGEARLDVARIEQGGFGSAYLQAQDGIRFDGPIDFRLDNQLRFDAPAFTAADAGSNVYLQAYAVQLGNFGAKTNADAVTAAATPVPGAASFSVSARDIGVAGHSVWNGFATTTLESRGEIHFDSIGRIARVEGKDVPMLDGSYRGSGLLELRAGRVSPSTYSQFLVEMGGSGSIRIARPLVSDALGPQLAAGGRLEFKANVIEQGGRVEAPLGLITFTGSGSNSRVELQAGSVTSVAADRELLLGRTLESGRLWEYDIGLGSPDGIGSSRVTVVAPEKQVLVNADNSTVDGATINLSGGGELLAWEFSPGPKGKVDILAAATGETRVFAILPGWQGGAAPVDVLNGAAYNLSFAYMRGTGSEQKAVYDMVPTLHAGDRIQLDNNALGLSGAYVLLPARYALLPGAVLVTVRDGQALPAGAMTQPGGGVLAAATRMAANADGSLSAYNQSRVTVELATRDVVANRAGYTLARGSDLLAGTGQARQLAGDAGRLSVVGRSSLAFDPVIIAQRVNEIVSGGVKRSGRGAELDLAAPRLEVVDAGTASSGAGWTTLDKDSLNSLGVSSLLLGGVRTRSGETTQIDTQASEVRVATSGNTDTAALRAGEVLLVAEDKVRVEAGSRIGAVDGVAVAAPTYALNGDGALVRVASGSQAGLTRSDATRNSGDAEIAAGALLSGKALIVDATRDNQLDGALQLRNLNTLAGTGGAVSLGAGRIHIHDSIPVAAPAGMNVDNMRLDAFASADEIRLNSYSSIDFHGNARLGGASTKSLVLSATGLAGQGAAGNVAQIEADSVRFENANRTNAMDPADAAGGGRLSVTANRFILGDNATAAMRQAGTAGLGIAGFSQVDVNASQEVQSNGIGVTTVSGQMNLNAGRVLAMSGSDQRLQTTGQLDVSGGGNTADATANAQLGGKLALHGSSLVMSGRILAPAGTVQLSADHDLSIGRVVTDPVTGISTTQAGTVRADGTTVQFGDTRAYASGGRIGLESTQGNVRILDGSLLSVSGGEGGNAGSIELSAKAGTVSAATGSLQGNAVAGASQGNLSVTAQSLLLDNLALAVRESAASGAINHLRGQWDIRRTSGDLSLSESITAAGVRIAADAGHVSIGDGDTGSKAVINASGSKGGRIELFAGAGKNVTLAADAELLARAETVVADTDNAGTRGEGGTVMLGSSGGSGAVITHSGSLIDVGVATGSQARGGKVVFRANESTSTANRDALNIRLQGAVAGASDVSAEFVRVINAAGIRSGATTGSGATQILGVDSLRSQLTAGTSAYDYDDAAKMANLRSLLGFGNASQHVRAGVEVVSSGDFSIPAASADIDLGTLNFLGEAGVLTIKAGGNITLNKSLSDGFSNATRTATLDSNVESWSYRLVAGKADNAANLMATDAGATNGSITLAANALLRTGTGNIDLAAAKDIRLVERAAIYTAGREDSANHPAGFVAASLASPRNLVASFGVAGGDISMNAGGTILMSRTASSDLAPLTQRHPGEWLVRAGGSSRDTQWYTNLRSFQQGVATLGGGDIDIRAGQSVLNLEVALPTNGRIDVVNGVADLAGARINGGGDLAVSAGGKVEGGLFYVESGRLGVNSADQVSNVALGLGNTQASVSGARGASLGDVFNPLSVKQSYVTDAGNNITQGSATDPFNMRIGTYGADSSLVLFALGGDARLLSPARYGTRITDSEFQSMAPGKVRVTALGGNVEVGKSFSQAPVRDGQLDLLASDSVRLTGSLIQYDVAAARMPSIGNPVAAGSDTRLTPDILLGQGNYANALVAHTATPWHADDREGSRIIALAGDVVGAGGSNRLTLNEGLTVFAGRDVIDLAFSAQHLRSDDISSVSAGRDVRFQTTDVINLGSFEVGGPGRLDVVAGRNVDLATAKGILTRGNLDNPYLPEGGADVMVLSGVRTQSVDAAGLLDLLAGGGGNAVASGFAAGIAAFVDQHPEYRTGPRETASAAALAQDVAAVKAMPASLRDAFVRARLFDTLRSTGREAVAGGGEASYAKGRAAIAALFPQAALQGGNIDFFNSQIKTEQGGDIMLLAPSGSVTVGIANPGAGSSSKGAAEQGLFTIRGGNILAYVDQDFLVNKSRVFTLDGGDILIWANRGNIDAGSGAKTVNSTPPPLLLIRNGRIELDTSASVSGSGIGALASKPTTPPSDLDLFAPQGAIDAGDAGLRSTGGVTLGATQILNSANIVAAGPIAGAPQAAATPVAVAAPSNPANNAANESRQTDPGAAGRQTQQGILTVEVLGADDEDDKRGGGKK